MKLVLLVLIIASLVACSSPPPVSYYQLSVLQPQSYSSAEQAESEYSLRLQPVMVANYLNGAGLVMQRSDVELIIANRHLWADALDQQMYRLLAEQLQARLPGVQLSAINAAPDMQLQLNIDRFHAQDNGVTVISGYYTLRIKNKLVTKTFSYQQPLREDGYPAMVSALSTSWQQLVDQLIVDITQQYL